MKGIGATTQLSGEAARSVVSIHDVFYDQGHVQRELMKWSSCGNLNYRHIASKGCLSLGLHARCTIRDRPVAYLVPHIVIQDIAILTFFFLISVSL